MCTFIQRDRDQLINTVSYTKGQAGNMISMVHAANAHISTLQVQASQVRHAWDMMHGADESWGR